jgi:hypothetical protein
VATTFPSAPVVVDPFAPIPGGPGAGGRRPQGVPAASGRRRAATERRRAMVQQRLGVPVAWAAVVTPLGTALRRRCRTLGVLLLLGWLVRFVAYRVLRSRNPEWTTPLGLRRRVVLAGTPDGVAVIRLSRLGAPEKLLDVWPTGTFAAQVWTDCDPVRLAVVLAAGQEVRAECGGRAFRGDAEVLPRILELARAGRLAVPPGYPRPPVGGPARGAAALAVAISWVLHAGVVLALTAHGAWDSGTPVRALQIGACYDGATTGLTRSFTPRSCDAPHRLQIVARPEADSGTYPGVAGLQAFARQACLAPARSFIAPGSVTPDLQLRIEVPNGVLWAHGDRHVTCFVANADGAPLLADVRGGTV